MGGVKAALSSLSLSDMVLPFVLASVAHGVNFLGFVVLGKMFWECIRGKVKSF